MALDTYANLKTAIGTWLDRDVSTYAADFVTLFETAANRRLRVRQMQTTATIAASGSAYTVPTDYLEWKEVTWQGSPVCVLEWAEPTYLDLIDPAQTSGIPHYFTIVGSSLTTRPLGTASTISFSYYQKIPALSDSATTNWLLTAHPDAYLFGCLTEATAFIENGGAAQLWASRRDAAFDEIERLSRQTQGQAQIRAYGQTP